ncbi:hypothetical protein IFR04_014864 [Cadophora malorum]|uniref:Heterokaryon incompatibility domain-containing protein n=1 Tax=Cadophora malorum TaxID=108018 RepID=A0A8H7W4I9_9HELO|nr:hypothetical protein IFR04_014864 [Cadophora malorum]
MSTSQAVKDAFALSLHRQENGSGPRRNSKDAGIGGTQLEELVNKVQFWINNCMANHPECQSQSREREAFLPSRLLDVGPPDGMQDPRLWATSRQDDSKSRKFKLGYFRTKSPQLESQHEENPSYVALSYCWGKESFLTTTHSTLKQREDVIPMIALPQTIRDAVWFTRLLGLRYLWVDSLCILQGKGKEAEEDWARESANMNKIYGGALVTVCASSSSHANGGIISKKGREFRPVGSRPHIVEEPLNRRAWALQDAFYHHGSKYAERLSKAPLPEQWYAIVEDYTSRQLTVASDRLPALAGIARLYAERTGQHYFAGLWREDILNGLLWRHFCSSGSRKGRPAPHRAPSWSWAAVDGPVEFVSPQGMREEHPDSQTLASVTSIEMASNSSLVAQKLAGRLVVEVILMNVRLTPDNREVDTDVRMEGVDEESIHEQPYAEVQDYFVPWRPSVQPDEDLDDAASKASDSFQVTYCLGQDLGIGFLDGSAAAHTITRQMNSRVIPKDSTSSFRYVEICCLPLTSVNGLLIQAVDTMRKEYRRIGVCSLTSSIRVSKFSEAFDDALRGMRKNYMTGRFSWLIGTDKAWLKKCAAIHAIADRYIEEEIERKRQMNELRLSADEISKPSTHKYVLLRELAKRHWDDKFYIGKEVINVFFAGRDSIRTVTASMLFLLARHPQAWEKPRNEVAEMAPQ